MGKGKPKPTNKAKKTDASIKKVTSGKKSKTSKDKSRGNPVEAMQPVESVKSTTENKLSTVEINPQTHHSLFSTSWLTNTNTPSDRKIVEELAKFCNANNDRKSDYEKIAKDLKVILSDKQPIGRRSEDITAEILQRLITALEEETTNPTLKARFDRIINANAERAYALDATCSLLNLVIYQEFSPTGTMLYLLTKLYQHFIGENQQNCLQISLQRLKDLLKTMEDNVDPKTNQIPKINRNHLESCLFPDRSSLTTNSSDEKELSDQPVAMTGCA